MKKRRDKVQYLKSWDILMTIKKSYSGLYPLFPVCIFPFSYFSISYLFSTVLKE